jgi:hypothetical protein
MKESYSFSNSIVLKLAFSSIWKPLAKRDEVIKKGYPITIRTEVGKKRKRLANSVLRSAE